MKYIKRFDTEEGYDSYYNSNSFILPNLSLIDELIDVGNEVRFNPDLDGPVGPEPEPEEPPYDPYNGHEYVDMGFPSGLKWARCNVEAEKESDYGLYFTWGETEGYTSEQVGNNSGQRYFHWITYKWCNGTQTTLNKYNYDSKYGTIDNKYSLESEDDAAIVNMRGEWRMPTIEEYEELLRYTTNIWTTVNGVGGRLFTSVINESTLFFPAAGYFGSDSAKNVGSQGSYWAVNIHPSLSYEGRAIYFYSDSRYNTTSYWRCTARPIRGVINIIQ